MAEDSNSNQNPNEPVLTTPSSPGGNGAEGDASSVEVEALKKEVAELQNKYLYLAADFDNFRKQAAKERSDLRKYGSEFLIREILEVMDNLERAAQTEIKGADGNESVAAYKNGVLMIVEQLKKALNKFGVEAVKSEGMAFDPAQHEALSSEENPDFPPNTVSRVFKKAYKLYDKLIRPAQVVVNTIKQK